MTDQREHDRLVEELSRTDKSSDPFAAAVKATRMPMLITDPNQHDNPIVFVNDAFSRLTEYSRSDSLGKNCRFLQGPETDPADVAKIRDAIDRRVTIEIELLNHKRSGEVFWNRLLISPVFDKDGVLTYFFASQFDVTLERDRMVRLQRDRDALEDEVLRRTEELRQSEARLHFMVKAGRLGTWSLTLADRRLISSDECRRIFGRPPGDPFTYDDLIAAIVPADRERMQAAVAASIEHRTDYDIEYRAMTPAGDVRWVQVRGQPSYRADGTPLSLAGVTIDATERKRGEEHRDLLAAELTHRVKNSMATMQSIAHQTLRTASDLDQARHTLDARLQSLSAAHDVLTRENWEGATLAEVVAETLRPFRSDRGRFSIGGPEIRMKPRAALAFVMALHELATNAVKYGALSVEAGRVIVSWEIVDGLAPERLRLRWEELGGPAVTPPTRTGFGSRMIERALASEIAGTAAIAYRRQGIVFTAEAPLAELMGLRGDLAS
ncbi:HWE histidine kinase domain-containing protein [Methylobacterium oryzisoli]|uniref:HWE histidine kinase domain-containing protein n=1 Tax=Methylobacterium oryzisoli TaxID=3385502 RepID=UPI0038925D22